MRVVSVVVAGNREVSAGQKLNALLNTYCNGYAVAVSRANGRVIIVRLLGILL